MGLPQPVDIGTTSAEFPGGSFNALVDGYYARRGQRQPGAQHNFCLTVIGPSLFVKIKNDTSEDREPGQILGIDGALIEFAKNERQVFSVPMLSGVSPLTADHADRFVVVKERIKQGKPGTATLNGLAWARVDVTDVDHEFAAVTDDDPRFLTSDAASGVQLIAKEKETEEGAEALGEQWAVVFLC